MPPYCEYRDFLPPEAVERLLRWVGEKEEAFAPSTVYGAAGAQAVDAARRISSRLDDVGPAGAVFSARVREIVGDAVARTRTSAFDPGALELELVAHNDGAHFARHVDLPMGEARAAIAGARGAALDRMLSCVYYFHNHPKGFSGGELRLYEFGAPPEQARFVDVAPEHNKLVVFPSWAPHGVQPVACPSGRFEDSRFAVNCWIHRAHASI